jgi:hypothetical protein
MQNSGGTDQQFLESKLAANYAASISCGQPEQKGDGSFRKIRVEVRHGIGRVRSRRGYYAQPE